MDDFTALQSLENYNSKYLRPELLRLVNYFGFVTVKDPAKTELQFIVEGIRKAKSKASAAESIQDYVAIFDKLRVDHPSTYRTDSRAAGKTSQELAQSAWGITQRVLNSRQPIVAQVEIQRPPIVVESSSSSSSTSSTSSSSSDLSLVSDHPTVKKLVTQFETSSSSAELETLCKSLGNKQQLDKVLSDTGLIAIQSDNKSNTCSAIIHAIDKERRYPNANPKLKRVLREPLTSEINNDEKFLLACKSSYTILNIQKLYQFAEGEGQLASRDKEQACLKTKVQIGKFLQKWVTSSSGGVKPSAPSLPLPSAPSLPLPSAPSLPAAPPPPYSDVVNVSNKKPCVNQETQDWNCDPNSEYCNVVKEPIQDPENTCEATIKEVRVGNRVIRASSDIIDRIVSDVRQISEPNQSQIMLGQTVVSQESLLDNRPSQAAAMNEEERRVEQIAQQERKLAQLAQQIERLTRITQEQEQRQLSQQAEEQQIRQLIAQRIRRQLEKDELDEQILAQQQASPPRPVLSPPRSESSSLLSILAQQQASPPRPALSPPRPALSPPRPESSSLLSLLAQQKQASPPRPALSPPRSESSSLLSILAKQQASPPRPALSPPRPELLSQQADILPPMVLEEEEDLSPTPRLSPRSLQFVSSGVNEQQPEEILQEIVIEQSNEFDSDKEEEVVLQRPLLSGSVPTRIEPSSLVKQAENAEQREREQRSLLKAQKKRQKDEQRELAKRQELLEDYYVVDVGSSPNVARTSSATSNQETKANLISQIKKTISFKELSEQASQAAASELEPVSVASSSVSEPVVLASESEIKKLVEAREVYESSQSHDDEKYKDEEHPEEHPEEHDVSLIEPVVEIQSGAIPEPSQFSVFNTSPDISADVRRCLDRLLEPRISSVSGREEKRDE